MSSQTFNMTDAHGRQVAVTTYDQASRVMGSFHGIARQYASALAGDLASARQLLPQAQELQRRFDQNVRIYQHLVALAEIHTTAGAMDHIAEQTKALHETTR